MGGVRKKQGWYPDSKRIEVTTLYAALGNVVRCAELAKIPECTIRSWKKQPWFVDLLREIREENNDKLDAKFTQILEKSLDLVEDRLDNGDPHVLRDGTIIRKPVAIRDLSIVNAISVDKRQILRKEPTTIAAVGGSIDEKLNKLAQAFTALANKQEIQPVEEPAIEDVEFEEVTEGEAPPTEPT